MHTRGSIFFLTIALLAPLGLAGCLRSDISETRGVYLAEASPQEPVFQLEPQAQSELAVQSQPVVQADLTTPAAKAVTAPVKTPVQRKMVSTKRGAFDPEKVQQDLDAFAQDCLIKMNRNIRPGINTKEVVAVPEGFRARYVMIDPDSLKTSFSASENKAVDYIGRLNYHEVEYISIGTTKNQALTGPFSVHSRRSLIELIKHMKGKWSY